MKIRILLVSVALLALCVIPGFAQQKAGSPADSRNPADFIVNHYAARSQFVAGAISRADLDTILQAGINAPSAMNRQPWHFTVVQTQALAKKMVNDIDEGSVLIIISAAKSDNSIVLDCGLATESIYLAAQALGYGSRIYTGPINNINKNLKADLGLPRDYSAVALVRIGKVKAGVDAVSAASKRSKVEDKVNFK
ncbi:MAG: nitroreductase family protein [Treponema sp.]|jgi:nitroreductase|nr:nitroreductase family protein [Treponema sp.]